MGLFSKEVLKTISSSVEKIPRSRSRQWPNCYTDSASAMEGILNLHFPAGTIIDVNFGLGVFYSKIGRNRVTGVDIRPTGDLVADNKALPFGDNSFDVAVCDPPYKRGDGKKYEQRYGKAPKTETKVTWDYYATLTECLRVARAGLIIKLQDGTDGHRFHARCFHVMHWMKTQTGLDPHDICVNVRRELSSTMAQGTPHFFQNGVSYWLIYAWKTKNPYRPVRF